MFEGDLTSLSTADLLESAADHRAAANRVDARLLEHAQIYADRFHPDNCPTRPGRKSSGGRERAIVLGGDGCPEIAEFAPAEFAVVVGVSTGVATRLIGEALALRHRFPFTWAKVQAGEATPWKARQIAVACLKLSEDAARYVDRRVASIVDTLTPYRLNKIITAARYHADAAAARADAEEKARERGVFVARGNDHGTTTIYIRTSTGNAKRYDATIAGIAEALKVFGDTRGLNARRAEAVGIVADPRYTEELLLQAQHHHAQSTADPDDASAEDGDADRDADPTTPDNNSAKSGVAAGSDSAATTDRTHGAGGPSPVPPATNSCDSGGGPHGSSVAPSIDPSRHQAASTPSDGSGVRLSPEPAERPRSSDDDALLNDWASEYSEPGPDDEADRDAPHPSQTDLPDPLDTPSPIPEPRDQDSSHTDNDTGQPMDPAAWRALQARLAQIKHDAHTTPPAAHTTRHHHGNAATTNSTPTPPSGKHLPSGATPMPSGATPMPSGRTPVPSGRTVMPSGETPRLSGGTPMPSDGTAVPCRGTPTPTDGTAVPSSTRGPSSRTGRRAGGGRLQPGKTEIYVHLTDHTLATGTGVLRVEELGPHLASQLAELVGHGPYVVKPVIDLNEPASVDAYEIPDRIRERVKLIHPAEQFPYGTAETTNTTDLDHIQPYDPLDPTEQTGTTNLVPLTRYHHRLKTHGRWKVRRLDPKTLEWTTPHGFVFHVDPTGTHRIPTPQRTPDPT
ncbi:uncharacterized protein DUF222 [Kribbella antiqua]|uniref:Uncharacterized protein DUF222 n=1 Tax=Kribbella antiqua TaxID=2512217 RepID=A0A4R2J0Y5_9ACTN|nr:HNH endonuclease signature motif containing protein [Kribbella antiqua]TCO51584.1 uncharacterized protein DUF222 [Kribbella antiqua]